MLQHAIERVGRPGGSHEGVGRKKQVLFWVAVFCFVCVGLFSVFVVVFRIVMTS